MSIRAMIMPDTYRDSAFLTQLSREVREAGGASQLLAVMGTARNKELLASCGLSTSETESAGPGDLVIATETGEDNLEGLLEAFGWLVFESDPGPGATGGDTAMVYDELPKFLHRVGDGPVGLVDISGSGFREISCLLERCGLGISRAYSAGDPKLKEQARGIVARTALARLGKDPSTSMLCLIGRQPGERVRAGLAEAGKHGGKPVFVRYLGQGDASIERAAGMIVAQDFTELAILTAGYARPGFDAEALFPDGPVPVNRLPGFLRGLFYDETLCREAAELSLPWLCGPKYADIDVEGYTPLSGSQSDSGHAFRVLSEDGFAMGCSRPAMAPEPRTEHLVRALCDPEVSVILLDVIPGRDSSRDQAANIVRAIQEADRISSGVSRPKLVAASVCCTEKDVPARRSQVELLEKAGAIILPSNARAAVWAARSADAGLPCKHAPGTEL